MTQTMALEYSLSRPITAGDVQPLFRQTSWASTREDEAVERMLAASVNIGAWDGDRLIGYARVVTDHVYRAFLEDVVVDEAYRGQKIGETMVSKLLEHVADVEDVILTTSENRRAFYERLQFYAFEHVHMHTKPPTDPATAS
jgi:ribosomal protein S18 acetylase RimI-like enzyme